MSSFARLSFFLGLLFFKVLLAALLLSCAAPEGHETLEPQAHKTRSGVFLTATADPHVFLLSHCQLQKNQQNCAPLARDHRGEVLYFHLSQHTSERDLEKFRSAFKLLDDADAHSSTHLSSGGVATAVAAVGSWSVQKSWSQWLRQHPLISLSIAAAAAATTVAGRLVFSSRTFSSLAADPSSLLWQNSPAPPTKAIPENLTLLGDIAQLERIFNSPAGGQPEGDPEPTPPPKPFPVIPPLQPEVDPGQQQRNLECSQDFSSLPASPQKLAECYHILKERGEEEHILKDYKSDAAAAEHPSELRKLRDDMCLNILYPLQIPDHRPFIIKAAPHGPFSPTARPPSSPQLLEFCQEYLKHSPRQDVIEIHKQRYAEEQSSTMAGKPSSSPRADYPAPAAGRTSGTASASSHQFSLSLSYEELCREILSLPQEISSHVEFQGIVQYCRQFLAYLKGITEHIRTEPISQEALELSPWYRSKLQQHLKDIMYRPSQFADHALSLAELTAVIRYQQQISADYSLAGQKDLDPEIIQHLQHQLQESQYINRLTSRVFEVQNDLAEGWVSQATEHLAHAEAPIGHHEVIPELGEYAKRWEEIKELYREVELEERTIAPTLPQKPDLEDVVRQQITSYVQHQQLAEQLATLRINYFALIDGKNAAAYSKDQLESFKVHKTLDHIRALPPGEFLDPDTITAYLMEIEKGLFHAYYTPREPLIKRIFAKEPSDEEHIRQLKKIFKKSTQNGTQRITHSTGDHLRFLRLLLLSVNQGKVMNELTPADILTVDRDPRLQELLDHDPYAALPHQLIMDNLQTLTEQFQSTQRHHINPGIWGRLFSGPRLIQSSDKSLRKKIDGRQNDDDFPLPSVTRR